jgi:hypothetical protein
MVMERFAAFEDSALLARIQRLQRAERDLEERMRNRARQAEVEGRWIPSDPMYQRLSSVVRQVRKDLRETEQENVRRASASAAREAAAA